MNSRILSAAALPAITTMAAADEAPADQRQGEGAAAHRNWAGPRSLCKAP